MSRRIAIIQGHPDPVGGHFCNALADAYAEAAESGGHEVRRIEVARHDFPLLRSQVEFVTGTPPPSLMAAQRDVGWAEHLLIVYPLWLGTMPALLKGFFEQVFRPGFAIEPEDGSGLGKKLGGKSARVVITMGMPALFYRWFYRAHSLMSLERNILKFCGIKPVRETLIGTVEASGGARHAKWLDRMRVLGRKGA